jgi:hypothetical protein
MTKRKTQLRAGHGRMSASGNTIWHTDSEGLYWIGYLYHRTPEELYKESLSVIADLLRNHPELARK